MRLSRRAGFAVTAMLACASAVPPATAQPAGTPSLRDLNTDAVPRVDQAGIQRVQRLLKDRGFDPVLLDGVLGSLTRGALSSYQEKYGIRTRGELDNQTLFALGAVDLAGVEAGQSR